jgi:ABC-type cobalamin/Fe3+-siderophores transport system ATPase subunit
VNKIVSVILYLCLKVVGTPRSGKSSLLKALAQKLPVGGRFSIGGKITYNGDTADSGKFNINRVASFVDQVSEISFEKVN